MLHRKATEPQDDQPSRRTAPGHWARTAGVATALVLALAGCSGGGNSAGEGPSAEGSPSAAGSAASGSPAEQPSARPTPVDPAPSPANGACYRVDYREALQPTTDADPVECGKGHTAQTFAVGTIDDVIDGHLLAVDSASVQNQIKESCPRRLAGYLGADEEDMRLSMLQAIWWSPTLEQNAAGQDWFRCDVVALARAEKLAPLGTGLKGALSTEEGRDRYGMCSPAEPGTDDFERRICSGSTGWQAIDTVDLAEGDQAPYPGTESAADAAAGPCQDAAAAVAEDTADYEWGYETPTKEQWSNGERYAVCWAPR